MSLKLAADDNLGNSLERELKKYYREYYYNNLLDINLQNTNDLSRGGNCEGLSCSFLNAESLKDYQFSKFFALKRGNINLVNQSNEFNHVMLYSESTHTYLELAGGYSKPVDLRNGWVHYVDYYGEDNVVILDQNYISHYRGICGELTLICVLFRKLPYGPSRNNFLQNVSQGPKKDISFRYEDGPPQFCCRIVVDQEKNKYLIRFAAAIPFAPDSSGAEPLYSKPKFSSQKPVPRKPTDLKALIMKEAKRHKFYDENKVAILIDEVIFYFRAVEDFFDS